VLTEAEAALLSGQLQAGAEVHGPGGCEACGGTGYRGRLPVYEIISVSAALETMIHEGASEAALTEEARKSSPSILEDGVDKILKGLTSVQEVARAVRDDAVIREG
jgi:general secretion pathway protein E